MVSFSNLLKHYHGFSVEEIASFFTNIPVNLPVVSVGSGRGELEKSLKYQPTFSNTIITVDPDPTSYTPKDVSQLQYHGIAPHYNYVSSLMVDQPSIVGNCVVLLPWPYPNSSSYDYEAILRLEPKYIVAIYEVIGGACGQEFHNWLMSLGSIYKLSWAIEKELTRKPKYDYKLCSIWKNYASYGLVIEGIVMLSRSDVDRVDNPLGNHISRGLHADMTEEEFVDDALRKSCLIA